MRILFESPDFVAIDKPPGLATVPGRGETDSALEQLARQLNLPCRGNQDPRVRVVHRLDKDTSGVLLFARHVAAQRHLSPQFQNNLVEKEYLALVRGHPAEPSGVIEAPLSVHPTDPARMTVSRRGRPARTTWQIGQSFGRYSLLRCLPETGKTHQIRVHLAHIGHPLVVDPLYGSAGGLMLSSFKRGYRPKPGEPERPLIARLTLHARKLAFRDLQGQRMEIHAPLPKDFRAALNMLAKYSR
ncbi:MAG: RluA family pseudouridine synthase [Phycisphaerae bacterium]|nr:RluA family pseudouridine synthase [Phycisphaerae bacterium]MDW8261596.1 RluA family pseudouridine synthase [Phycisphaerales bacterium]